MPKYLFRSTLISLCLLSLNINVIAVEKDTQKSYKVYSVKKQIIPITIDVAGTVVPQKTVTLSAQLPGRINFIAGEEGDAFKAGQLLVSIDDSGLRAKQESAYAQRDSAYAAIRNARAQLNREIASPMSESSGKAPGGMGLPAMMDQMFTSPMQDMTGMRDQDMERESDLILRQTQLAQTYTNYKQSEAQIKEIEATLRDAVSVAPFDGVIKNIHIEVGDTIQPGQRIVEFSQIDTYKIEVKIPVRLSRSLKKGMKVLVKLDNNQHIAAPVSRIFPIANAKDHTVHTEIDLPKNTDTTAGSYAAVSIPDRSFNQASNLAIPETAIVRKNGLPLVFSLDDEGKTRIRIVRLGEASMGGMIIILSGVQENDKIIANPDTKLRAGQQIIKTKSTSEKK